jgi:hypothetical protein
VFDTCLQEVDKTKVLIVDSSTGDFVDLGSVELQGAAVAGLHKRPAKSISVQG